MTLVRDLEIPRLLGACLVANNEFSRMGEKKIVCLVAHGRKNLCIARILKHPKKLHAEERSIRPFLAMQPRLMLVGAF
jgi:hypothetical protein